MWLHIDLDGIDYKFRIKEYHVSSKNWEDEWSKVDLILTSENWLNYSIINDEMLLMCEIEELRDELKRLLNDELDENTTIREIEPDLTFELFPKSDVRDNPRIIYVREGYETIDISMNLSVGLWHEGALTANKLELTFGREDIEKLVCYLDLITGKINKSDEIVQEYIRSGTFLAD